MIGLLMPLISGLVQQKWQNDIAAAMPGLLGKKESNAAGEEGPVQVPGSGLMADPADPMKQMEFARGLMAMPGGTRALQSFQPYLQSAIQSKQWTQQFEQGKTQYEQTEARLTDQFQKDYGLRQDEAQAMAQQRIQQQQNWQAEFDERLRQNAYSRQMEGARLQLARNADKREAGKSDIKIPSGYELSPSGGVQPMANTPDFVKAKTGEGALMDAMKNIDELRDLYLGKEQTTDAGEVVRRGGWGAQKFGPESATMANKRGAIISAIGTLREMGVLDKNEYERLSDQLPDPGSWSTKDATFDAGYKEARAQFAKKLATHRAANPFLVPAPPAGFRPKQ